MKFENDEKGVGEMFAFLKGEIEIAGKKMVDNGLEYSYEKQMEVFNSTSEGKRLLKKAEEITGIKYS